MHSRLKKIACDFHCISIHKFTKIVFFIYYFVPQSTSDWRDLSALRLQFSFKWFSLTWTLYCTRQIMLHEMLLNSTDSESINFNIKICLHGVKFSRYNLSFTETSSAITIYRISMVELPVPVRVDFVCWPLELRAAGLPHHTTCLEIKEIDGLSRILEGLFILFEVKVP